MERRRDERIASNLGLTCRVPALPRWSVMHDVSHTGCRLEFRKREVELGGSVVLEVPGARRVNGQVMWTHGSEVGIEFERWVTGHTAVALGLDEPDLAPAPAAEPGQGESNLAGLISHWFRRLAGLN